MFFVGQKVVCIDAQSSGGHPWFPCGLTEGHVYTVRGVGEYDCIWLGRNLCMWLEEIVRGEDVPFHVRRFRPLVERKTDISCFTRILARIKEPERV